jgi:hypothetical protein
MINLNWQTDRFESATTSVGVTLIAGADQFLSWGITDARTANANVPEVPPLMLPLHETANATVREANRWPVRWIRRDSSQRRTMAPLALALAGLSSVSLVTDLAKSESDDPISQSSSGSFSSYGLSTEDVSFEDATSGAHLSTFSEDQSSTANQAPIMVRVLAGLQDFAWDDWDGEGARGITQEIIGNAEQLLGKLAPHVPQPEVAPAADGSLCMEWNSAAGVIWLDIEPDGTAAVLVQIGTKKIESRFRVNDPRSAVYLQAVTDSLFPAQRGGAVRQVLVLA